MRNRTQLTGTDDKFFSRTFKIIFCGGACFIGAVWILNLVYVAMLYQYTTTMSKQIEKDGLKNVVEKVWCGSKGCK